MIGGLFGIVDDFIEDPIGTAAKTVTQPLSDAVEVFQGLTEGELRIKAAARLGTDVAAGMAVSELVEWAESAL